MKHFLSGLLLGLVIGLALVYHVNLRNKLRNGESRYILDSQTGKIILKEYK